MYTTYCIVLGKCLLELAAQAPKIEGEWLHRCLSMNGSTIPV